MCTHILTEQCSPEGQHEYVYKTLSKEWNLKIRKQNETNNEERNEKVR